MSRKDTVEQKTWDLIGPVLEKMGMRPVDAEFVKEGGEYSLRIYIDKDGGVGINDCEAVSRAIDPMLDEENFISEPYTLIVSSPGLGRVLKRPHDFEFGKGKEVEIRFYKAVDGEKELRGILKDADAGHITVEIDGADRTFERPEISRIRLAVDF